MSLAQPILPPELWEYVAALLSNDDVWRLRQLNRWFWDVAWSRQCRLVYLDAEKLTTRSREYWWNARQLRYAWFRS